MLRLDELKPHMRVRGLSAEGPAVIIAVMPYSAAAAKVTFEVEPSGRLESRVLMRADAERLTPAPDDPGRAFDADGRLFRLVLEAERLRLAHLFDPRLAMSTSRVEALPHQIETVYDTMLPRQPLRFLLADDPGAGKTIMTALLIKELLLRADIERCLIVVPAALDGQWQDELRDKFGLRFALAGREQMRGALDNVFAERDLVIGRIDLLKQDEQIERLMRVHWDLVVVDEAHKMSATYLPGPNEVKTTARYRLGQALGERTRHFLLLTATPHRGKQADFELLLALLDPDRFAGGPSAGDLAVAAGDLMRRRLKEDLVDFDGRPLFPERFATTVSYTLSEPERALYDAVTHYVRQEMTRADQMATQGDGNRRRAVVGFALSALQRRMASSPEAILRSLARRRARLAATAEALRDRRAATLASQSAAGREPQPARIKFDIDLGVAVKGSRLDVAELETDLDERPEGEADVIVDRASAAQSLADLEREVDLLWELEARAGRLRALGVDAKWQRLRALLADPAMFDEDGRRQKLVVFTEHRDTLDYLV
ncbi:MAG TPA: SNF2-related protein, partial [Thermomicrobiales bacterium]|nr:SNF2-related protein [Thermomicrobiales bacterium]